MVLISYFFCDLNIVGYQSFKKRIRADFITKRICMQVKEQLYILDTNVLVEDPEVIFRFQQARVGIPITVLE